MLARAVQRAKELGIEVDLRQMDVEDLEVPDDAFDAAVGTCVFC